ncbi:MAG: MBL fold metallo-hydrolase [Oscillospiraceae bacterium]|nr:MBL fold metallo-hydrolase [Oscillospiraceae bacterium]
MKVTVLIENAGSPPLCCEHGLSLFVDHPGGSVLLDAGQSGDFLKNADTLNIPVQSVPTAVLSHGHYDHGDGFLPLLRIRPELKILARRGVLDEHRNPKGKYIGLCAELKEEYAGRFDSADGIRELGPGLYLVPDGLYHEQSLVAEREDGTLVVMNSCCHAGADDIVEGILDSFPGRKVHALIGGLHLMGPGGVETMEPAPEEVEALARRLTGELGVERVYTGHCTGIPAFSLLRQTCPERFFPLRTGLVLNF